jgi:phage tail-like protein
MSTQFSHAYYFQSPSQWGQTAQLPIAEHQRIDARQGVEIGHIVGPKLRSIALAANGDLLALDCFGQISVNGHPGPVFQGACKIFAGPGSVWLHVEGRSEHRLVQLDQTSLQVLGDTSFSGLIDACDDGEGGLWLLGDRQVTRFGCQPAGSAQTGIALAAPAITMARAGSVLALLCEDGRSLILLDVVTGEQQLVDIVALAQSTASEADAWNGKAATLDANGETILVSSARPETGQLVRFILINSQGGLLGSGGWQDNIAPTHLIIDNTDLVGVFALDHSSRIRRFSSAALSAGVRILTPALETANPSGAWHRAEIIAELPERAIVSLRWAVTSDERLRQLVTATLSDSTRSRTARMQTVDMLFSALWSEPCTYVGEAARQANGQERFAFPLHAAVGPMIWVDVQMRQHTATTAPAIKSIRVDHEAESLIDHLPAIFRNSGDGDGTMRGITSVLEATTQGLDSRIAHLATRLNPAQTSARWLPDLAAMLGLPFHDDLSADMQRRLAMAAGPILAGRGTRQGLLAMLDALFPQGRARVLDRTEQLIPVALGHGILPSLLSGPSARVPKLNARLVLGKTRLCAANACADSNISPPSQVLIVICATSFDVQRFGVAVSQMIEAMVPAYMRPVLRWLPARGEHSPDTADVLSVVTAPQLLHLGGAQPLGSQRLGGRLHAHLDSGGAVPGQHRIL